MPYMEPSEKHTSYLKKIGIINLGGLLMLIAYQVLTDSDFPWLALVNLMLFNVIYYGSHLYLSKNLQTNKFFQAYFITSAVKLALILSAFAIFLKFFPALKYQNLISLVILYLLFTSLEVMWVKRNSTPNREDNSLSTKTNT